MKKLIIVIPAHNEEEIIENTVKSTLEFLKKKDLKVSWELVVGENGSKDKTLEILKKIPKSKHFTFFSLGARSRDNAIKEAWNKVEADYYMYMDADLATDVKHIPDLIKGLESGYDIVIGSRRLHESEVYRPLSRRAISFVFHSMMKIIFNLKVKDLQCGFKAINKEILDKIIPQIKYGQEGFMDTEMLVLASQKKYRIKEIPVKWEDTRDSKFQISKQITTVIFSTLKIKRDLILGRYK